LTCNEKSPIRENAYRRFLFTKNSNLSLIYFTATCYNNRSIFCTLFFRRAKMCRSPWNDDHREGRTSVTCKAHIAYPPTSRPVCKMSTVCKTLAAIPLFRDTAPMLHDIAAVLKPNGSWVMRLLACFFSNDFRQKHASEFTLHPRKPYRVKERKVTNGKKQNPQKHK
jgi:hypothetical protein